MADNEIRVVITGVASDLKRALEGAKGDLGGLKAAIKDVPNQINVDVQAETAAAQERLRALRDIAKDVDRNINIKADADTGVAEAKLKLLERQAHDTENAIARAQLGGGAGGFGSSLLSAASSGGVPGLGKLGLGALAAPLAAGAAGSLTALAGSLGAATLGFGALSTAMVGAATVGGGAMMAVLIPAKTAVTNVATAVDALQKAQEQYGAGSKQAATAQQSLNAVMAEAGPQASKAGVELGKLKDQWTALSQPAQKALFTDILTPGLHTLETLLPTVAKIAQESFAAIGKALQPVFQGLASPAFKQVLLDLANTFAKLSSPLIGAFANLMTAFFHVAVAASPYLVQAALAFERWTKTFSDSLAPGAKLEGLIATLVAHLHSWFDLTVALGRIVVTLFKDGAETGKSLVDQLTAILTKWNAWLNTEAGRQAVTKFFTDSANLLKAVLGALKPVVELIGSMSVGLIPTMTLLLKPLAELLNTIAHWINDLSKNLPPVLNALPGLALAAGVLTGWKLFKDLTGAAAASILTIAKNKIGIAGAAGGAASTAETAGTAGLLARITPGLLAAATALIAAAAATKAILGPNTQTATPGRIPGPQDNSRIVDFGPTNAISDAITGGASKSTLNIKEMGNFANYTTSQLKDLIASAKTFDSLRLNGVAANKNQLLALAQAALQTKQHLDQTFSDVARTIGQRFQNMGQSLGQLKDDFNSNTKLIATYLGTNTAKGRQAMEFNISTMIQNVTQGMLTGKINVQQGLAAINQSLQTGVNSGAISWKAKWQDMFSTVNDLFAHGKLTAGQYADQVRQILVEGAQHTKQDTEAHYTQMMSNLQTQLNNGVITQAQFNQKVAVLNAQRNTDESNSLSTFADHMYQAMFAAGGVTLSGAKAVVKELNSVLGPLGATKIPDPTGVTVAVANLAGTAASNLGNAFGTVPPASNASGSAFRTGGLVQIGQPGEKGRDTVPLNVAGQPIAVGRGEQVAVFNDQQQKIMNSRLADMGGLPGMFSRYNRPHYMAEGGFVPGFAPGGVVGTGLIGAASPAGGGTGFSGYSLPLPRQYINPGSWTFDQGVDMAAPGGTPEFAIGPGVITGEGISGFGPNAPILRVDAGPLAGTSFYYGHAGPDTVGVGAHVTAGQQISEVGEGIVGISTGPHIEFGVWPPVGGAAVATILNELLSGAKVTGVGGAGGGGAGGATWTDIASPKVQGSGLLTKMVQKGMDKLTAAGNAYGQKQAAALGGSGSPNVSLSGPVEQQVFQFMSAAGFNKMAIAGMLGNAQQESGMNPNTPGGGLWQQISNFGLGTGGSLLQQMQTMLPQIQQYKGDLNSATSPGDAATRFMNDFERPGIPALANRISAANAAFAAGYDLGGLVPGFATGGSPSTSGTGRNPALLRGTHHTAPKSKKQTSLKGKKPVYSSDVIGTFPGGFPFDLSDMKAINAALGTSSTGIEGLIGIGGQGGDAQLMSDTIAHLTSLYSSAIYPSPNFSSWASPADFVISTDPTTGQAVTPYISTNINTVGQQLMEVSGDQGRWVADLQGGLQLSQGLTQAVQNAINYRVKEVAKIKAKVQANIQIVQKVQDHMKTIVDRQKKIQSEWKKKNPNRPFIHTWTQDIANLRAENNQLLGLKTPDNDPSSYYNASANSPKLAADWQSWNKDMDKLQAQNWGFVGDKMTIPSTPGGEMGEIQAQLGEPAQGSAVAAITSGGSSSTGLYQLQDVISGWISQIGGVNGDAAQQSLQQRLYQQGIANLAPGASVALQNAQASAGSQDNSQMVALLQQQLAASQHATAVSESQFGVLSDFAPLLQGRLVGSFQSGIDFVPQTGLALVHRGETITPDPGGPAGSSIPATVQTAQGAMEVVLVMQNDEKPLMKLVDARMNAKSLQIVSDHSGQRARLMAGVRRAP